MNLKHLVMFMLMLVSYVKSNTNNNSFFPRLPIGEYQINAKSILPCDPNKHNKIQINWYVNKISLNEANFQGNMTISVPFDDNLTIHGSFDQKSSNGGWAVNSIMFKKDKACSTFMSFIREKYKTTFGCVEPCPCPFVPGTYIMKGFPATNIKNALVNLPRSFIYGTYRFRFFLTSKTKEQIACLNTVIDVSRLWETL